MIVELLNKVDTISNQFVFNGYQQIVNAYSPAIYGLICLFITVYGFAVLQGWINLSLAETSKRLLLVGFILSFALNWGIFSEYIYDLFTKVPSEIAVVIVKSIPGTHYADCDSVNAALQQVWRNGIGYGLAAWDRGSFSHLLPYFFAVSIFILIFVLVGYALIELIAAKFGLAILLVLSPLIIPLMLFKATKEIIFDGWLKHLVAFALVPIFVSASLALGLTLLSDSITNIEQAISLDTFTIVTIAPYILCLFIVSGLVFKATHMSASIANGFTIGMGPHVGRAALMLTRLLKIDRRRPPSIPILNNQLSSKINTFPTNPKN